MSARPGDTPASAEPHAHGEGGDATTVTVRSTFQAVSEVQTRIMAEVEAHRYPPACVFALRLALDEAMSNAVKHGNAGDPTKRVTVSHEVTRDRVTVSVEDEGPGFAPEDLADPTRDDRLACPHGRGVMLMRAYMTEVRFNRQGNRVTLVKDRNCPAPDLAGDDDQDETASP